MIYTLYKHFVASLGLLTHVRCNLVPRGRVMKAKDTGLAPKPTKLCPVALVYGFSFTVTPSKMNQTVR